MSLKEWRTDPSGTTPGVGEITVGPGASTSARTVGHGQSPASILSQELWSIEQQLASLERLQYSGDTGADELIAQCVLVWTRIKQLHQRYGI